MANPHPKLHIRVHTKLSKLATAQGQTVDEYLTEHLDYGMSRWERQHWEKKLLELAACRIEEARREHTAG